MKAFVAIMLIMAIIVVGFGFGSHPDFFKVMNNMLKPIEKVSTLTKGFVDFFYTNEGLSFRLDDEIEVYHFEVKPLFGSNREKYDIYLGVLAGKKNYLGTKNVYFLGATTEYRKVILTESNFGLDVHVSIVHPDGQAEVWSYDLKNEFYTVMNYKDFLLEYGALLYDPMIQ